MHQLSRRALLGTVAAAGLLAGCNPTTEAQVVTLTQAAMADAQLIMTGLKTLVSSTALAKAEADLAVANTYLSTLLPSIGKLVPITSVSQAFTDIEVVVNDLAGVPGLSTNPYFMAISVLIPILGAAWNMVTLAPLVVHAQPTSMSPDQARATLATLPVPAK
jgi:hypothetical protein